MSKIGHMTKVQISYFREDLSLSSRVTGGISEVFTGKTFFFQNSDRFASKIIDFEAKNMIIFDFCTSAEAKRHCFVLFF